MHPSYGGRYRTDTLDGRRLNRGSILNHIEQLKALIEQQYGTTATHVETVPVHETFNGETIWDGEVEVFDVPEFENADRVFAWNFEDDDGEQQQVTVAQISPASDPSTAVKAYLISQYGNRK